MSLKEVDENQHQKQHLSGLEDFENFINNNSNIEETLNDDNETGVSTHSELPFFEDFSISGIPSDTPKT